MSLEEIFEKFLTCEHSALFYTPPVFKNSQSYIFTKPAQIISAVNNHELSDAFDEIDSNYKKGRMGYGYIGYEAGYLLENKLSKLYTDEKTPLLQFCFFDKENVRVIKSSNIDFVANGLGNKYKINSFKLNSSRTEYINSIKKIKEEISEGNTYQVNYTVKGVFNFSGKYIDLFKNLVFNQSAQYTAFINDTYNTIISLSPELFFSLQDNQIVTRPMKGTIKRGLNNYYDSLQREILRDGDKNKAENIMIVDLLRNDFGKIAEFNSVKAEKIFNVEKYETLFQMVSDVTAKLKPQVRLKKIFANVFPCGSITGAPKIKTMEIINSLEKEKRGIYTGAIGIVGKSESVFNVAIRTIILNKASGKGEIGIGSGIVADSVPADEYRETLLKQNFLTKPDSYYELFETMLLENGKYFLPDAHINRLKNAAGYFLFKFDRAKILRKLKSIIDVTKPDKKYRVRLTLNKWGSIGVTFSEYRPTRQKINIIISAKAISTGNKFQYFKTTNRKLYDTEFDEYTRLGFADVIFFNEKKHLAEGAISNIFILKNKLWYTPSLECGILPGIYRNYMMSSEAGKVNESLITRDDLMNADKIVITNSLRGKRTVNRLYFSRFEFKEFK